MSLQSTDQVADLLTRIRNAVMVGKNEILVPTSKLKVGVAEVLARNGYPVPIISIYPSFIPCIKYFISSSSAKDGFTL